MVVFWSENIGWGAQLNMSFKQMREKLLQVDGQHIDIRWIKKGIWYENVDFEQRFYPKYGICFDIDNYSIDKDIDMLFSMRTHEYGPTVGSTVEVFITDRKLKTANTVDTESHWGSSITIPSGSAHEYLARVELLSFFDPRNTEACKSYNVGEYENCVAQELFQVWKPLINCNPPWLTSMDQCSEVIYNRNGNVVEIQKKVSETVNGHFSCKRKMY
jgi:hypothetical protein